MMIDFPTAEVFEPLLQPARYKGAWGGRGSGKSHFFGGLLIEDHLMEKGLHSVCIREIQKSLNQSAKKLLENKIKEKRLEASGFKIFRDVIETPGDGLIIFQGMQDHTAESVKSLEGYGRAWIEEAQTLSKTSLKLLRPTIRAEGSQIWASWNPRRKSDPIDQLLRAEQPPDSSIIVKANWSDNPWLPKELDQERRDDLRLNPDEYDNVWEGGYIRAKTGAYFAKQLAVARREQRLTRLPVDPLLPIYTFWDIGGTSTKSDACAIWVAQFAGKETRLIDYYEAVGQELKDHVAWLKKKGYEGARCFLPHDGKTHDRVSRVTYESELKKAEFPVFLRANDGAGAALFRIDAIRRVFPHFVFDKEKCEAGIEAIGWYHEKQDETRLIGLGPNHDWSSHAADSLGLLALEYDEITRVKPKSKPTQRRKGAGSWMRS